MANAEHGTCRQLQEDHNFKPSFATIKVQGQSGLPGTSSKKMGRKKISRIEDTGPQTEIAHLIPNWKEQTRVRGEKKMHGG